MGVREPVDGVLLRAAAEVQSSVLVQFSVTCGSTIPGEDICVVGSLPELGSWSPRAGLRCRTAPEAFPRWTAPLLKVPPGVREFELKLAVVRETQEDFECWEHCRNRTLTLPDVGKDTGVQLSICREHSTCGQGVMVHGSFHLFCFVFHTVS